MYLQCVQSLHPIFSHPERLASRRFVCFGCKARLFLKGKRHQRHLIANERATLICLQLKVPLPRFFSTLPLRPIWSTRSVSSLKRRYKSILLPHFMSNKMQLQLGRSRNWSSILEPVEPRTYLFLQENRELGVWPILHIFLCWLTLTQHIPGISEVLTWAVRTWDPIWIASGKYGLGWCASWWSATLEFESFHKIQLNLWWFEELFGN